MGVACGLGSLDDLLQLVVPEKLRAPVVEQHVEGDGEVIECRKVPCRRCGAFGTEGGR
jgi:hypothetical protein